MAEDKFKLQLDIKTGDDKIDLYIWELHNYLCEWEVSSIKQLLISLDRLAQKLSDDIDHIAEGREEALTILRSDKDDKIFDRLMTLISKIKDFKTISELAESLRPEIAEKKEEVKSSKPKIQIDLGDHPFEALQGRRIKGK